MTPKINNEQPQQELDKVFAEPGQIQATVIERPIIVEDEHLTYLDGLREGGTVNMLGARPFLQSEFGLNDTDSAVVHSYWMESYAERHPVKEGQTA